MTRERLMNESTRARILQFDRDSPQFKEMGIKTEILPECLNFQVVRVYFIVVSFLLKLDDGWARRRSKGTNGIGLDTLFRTKWRVIEINRAFNFPCIHNRAS